MEKRMRRTVLGVTFILLSLGVGSCGLIGGDDADVEESAESPSEQSFPSPSPEIPTPPSAKVALTRPTNPDERLRIVKSGRSDPFADIVPPILPGSEVPNSSSPGNSPTTVTLPKPGSTLQLASPSKPGTSSSAVKPGILPGKIVLPTLPKPEVAQGVKVMGVVVVGSQPQAILKAPGEKATRTVGVGERIANGQVLVKAINLSNPAAPVVVLEQAGREVTVGVGQQPLALASDTKK
jgi:hypothetical protein